MFEIGRQVVTVVVGVILVAWQAAVGTGGPAGAADFYVSVEGDDGWSGRQAAVGAEAGDGPFASVARAKEAVRALRQAEPEREGPIVVAIRGGRYELEETLRFTPADSGREGSPVVYRAYEDEHVRISGGRRIEGWEQTQEGWWQADVGRDDQRVFSQLFVNDQRRFRPRLPAQGYFYMQGDHEPTQAHADRGHDRMGYAEGDWPEGLSADDDVEVVAFHTWSTSRMRIAEIDAEQRVITFTGPTRALSHWGRFRDGHRYFLDNVGEALGEVRGEFYLDREAGVLTYVPREGESIEHAKVIAPRLEQLMTFEGDIGERAWVEHLRFEGLDFAHTRWRLQEEGQSFPQAAIQLSGAIAAVGARHVSFTDCVVRHTGGYAFDLGAGSRHVNIERAELIDLGAGGVKLGHTAGQHTWTIAAVDTDDEQSQVLHNSVRDSTIAHGGRLHPAAVGVWIGHASHSDIEHNDIHDFYYTGISVGWTWGYHEPSQAHHNRIAYNHVHRIGQGVLSDMGGIYTLGVSPGTVVKHNRFHDIHSYGYGGWGLYTDEGSTGILMENNLVYDTRTGGFHQHYGRDNVIRNNILAHGQQHQLQRTRQEDHSSFTFERNIVYWENDSPLLASNWDDGRFEMRDNLYYHPGRPADEITFPGGRTLEQWQEQGHERGSRIADPRFADAGGYDFELGQESPAMEIGFERFDLDLPGRVSEPRWVDELPEVPRGFE